MTWTNESKVAVVTWRAGNTRNQLRNEIAMDIVVFASLRPGWHPSPRRRGGGGILVKYVGKEQILKNHMLVVVTLKEKVLYVIPNQCKNCDIASSSVKNLRASRHTGEKPFLPILTAFGVVNM